MIIGDRLREMRELKKMSQGDIQQRTGLFRCYISRVENGHTVPSINTLEKFARTLRVPMYLLLYDGENPPKPPELRNGRSHNRLAWGASGKQARMLHKFRRALSEIDDSNRMLILSVARKMAARSR
jgi:transcriptional regulator with XRE-family HTH domain